MFNRNPTLAALAFLATAAPAAHAALSGTVVAPGVTAGVNDVTGIITKTVVGTPYATTNTAGEGAAYSPYKPTNAYDVAFTGQDQQVTSIIAGGATFAAAGMATNVVRRYVGADTDHLWYTGADTATVNHSTITVNGPALDGFGQAFDQNNIDLGADNLFSTVTSGTTANPVGDNTDVDRVDLLFAGGLAASTKSAFFIADRGEANDHDAFAVAAITGLDASGNPTGFGPLLQFKDGTWGRTTLIARTEEEILREDDGSGSTTLHPADHTTQPIGGVAITTAELAAGTGRTTIYGYALFSPDVTVSGTGAGTQLVDYQDGNVYGRADSTSTGGGLDPAATIAVLYTEAAVPEPTAAALIAAAGCALLGRRRRVAIG